MAYDTSHAYVTMNQPPVANAGRDTTLFQCSAAPISIAASCSDPDGNLSTCQLISSPGSYSGGNITFTPTGSGTYTFILKATDACGLIDYDTSRRVCNDQSAAGCECRDATQRCSSALRLRSASRRVAPIRMVTCQTCQLISSPGSYSGGNITFTPTGSGTYTFILKATDACGLIDL